MLLGQVGRVVDRFGLEVHAYALMPNHYHFLVRSVNGNLSRCMQHLNGPYTQTLNQKHNWDGPVFRGRFHNQLVDESEHLRVLVPYIHLNPVRKRLVILPDQAFWTSYPAYIGQQEPPEWLRTDVVLSLFGSVDNLIAETMGYHSRELAWPSDFDLRKGVFTSWSPEIPVTLEAKAAARENRLAYARRVIGIVTGVPWAEVVVRKSGPGGNPRLRFAAWALADHTDLTYTQIGRALAISTASVGVFASRARKCGSDQMKDWMRRYRFWSEEE